MLVVLDRNRHFYGLGYFVLLRNNNEQVSTTFHLASLENIRLILAHSREVLEQAPVPKTVEVKDSLETDSVRRVIREEPLIRPNSNTRVRSVSPRF